MKHRAFGTGLLVTFLALLLLVAGGAGWFLVRPRSIEARPVNIVIISLDTCRADHLSCYGFPRETTPNIDNVAREGLLFENAISPVPMTLPAHASLLTGTIPPYHGVHGNISYRLRDSNVTLAELLREHGYTTGAVVASFVLDPQFGLAQGFDFYDARFESHPSSSNILSQRPGGEVSDVAEAWLEQHADDRFFLFVHYYDPHFPYDPPEPFASRFPPPHRYAGEVAYADRCVGRVIDKLKTLGLYDSTMIIITADHGEGQEEHGEATHGYFVYHSTTKVPLIIKLPNRTEARRIAEKVALVDVFPTLLEYVGIPAPETVHGQSLVPFFSGGHGPGGERDIFSESLMATRFGCSSLLALETPGWKYIQSSKPELYDLVQDREELNNVVGDNTGRATAMRERLRALLEESTRVTDDDSRIAMDPETLKRLETLGYVDGGMPETLEFDTDKESPADFLPFFRKIARASELLHRDPKTPFTVPTADGGTRTVSKYQAAKRICGEVLAERPDLEKAHSILGRIAHDEGLLDAAVEHFTELVRINPGSAAARNDLGNMLKAQGRIAEAVALYEKALELAEAIGDVAHSMDAALAHFASDEPVLLEARLGLGDALFRQGKTEEAGAVYREALAIKPGDARANYVVGLAASMTGKYDEAISAFQAALDINPQYEAARRELEAARRGQKTSTSR